MGDVFESTIPEEHYMKKIADLESKLHNAEMINLIGEQIKTYRENSDLKDNQFFFDYLKREIKDKRKMGHLTILR